jgi:hypothetical protein
MLPISTYPMWYNVIPPFVPLDCSFYQANPTRTKGFDYLIFRNYRGYVPRNVYAKPKQPIVPPTYIPYSIGNQFLLVVQPMIRKDRELVQQPIIIASMPTIVQVIISLLAHIPRGFDH